MQAETIAPGLAVRATSPVALLPVAAHGLFAGPMPKTGTGPNFVVVPKGTADPLRQAQGRRSIPLRSSRDDEAGDTTLWSG
jgi:hypothetical protein